MDLRPIGFFDSGVGGLTILRAVRQFLPQEEVVYVADQAHIPYGIRPLEEVRAYSAGVTRFLLQQGAKLIVVACNTASAAALSWLRQTFPDLPFVGMEPAVKPAAEQTRSGIVGVLATQTTFQGEPYATLVERFAHDVKIMQDPCLGLVKEIEAGHLDSPVTRGILEKALQPMLEAGIDTVVLGCTHYPFVKPLIEEIVGKAVRVIDPSPAVARQTQRLLEKHNLLAQRDSASVRFFTTGSPLTLQNALRIMPVDSRTDGSTGIDQLIWRQNAEVVEGQNASLAWELHG